MSYSLVNTKALIKMRGRKYQKNGQTFLKFDTFGLKIKNGPTQLKLSNLFKGNKSLEEIGMFLNPNTAFTFKVNSFIIVNLSGNRFINDNVQSFLDEINPGLEKSLTKHFTNVANQIVESASVEETFPEYAPNYN